MRVRRPTVIILALVVCAAIAVAVLARRAPAKLPVPSGSFAFAALGDAPYYPWEDIKFNVVLKDMALQDLVFVIHVGDIIWHPCSDDLYNRVLGRFNKLPHPVIYTPGDNEWTDCWEQGSGSFRPLERLQRLRQIFFTPTGQSLGGTHIPLETQAGEPAYSEFVENTRWMEQGFLFACVNLPGSRNARETFPERTAADDEASVRRTAAGTAWLKEAFLEAKARIAEGVIIVFHADPGFEEPSQDDYRSAYEPFMQALEDEAAQFAKPVLVIHGDDHEYKVDHPLVERSTGQRLQNLTRLEVPGSPRVGWVRVLVTPGSKDPFRFEEHALGAWQYW